MTTETWNDGVVWAESLADDSLAQYGGAPEQEMRLGRMGTGWFYLLLFPMLISLNVVARQERTIEEYVAMGTFLFFVLLVAWLGGRPWRARSLGESFMFLAVIALACTMLSGFLTTPSDYYLRYWIRYVLFALALIAGMRLADRHGEQFIIAFTIVSVILLFARFQAFFLSWQIPSVFLPEELEEFEKGTRNTSMLGNGPLHIGLVGLSFLWFRRKPLLGKLLMVGLYLQAFLFIAFVLMGRGLLVRLLAGTSIVWFKKMRGSLGKLLGGSAVLMLVLGTVLVLGPAQLLSHVSERYASRWMAPGESSRITHIKIGLSELSKSSGSELLIGQGMTRYWYLFVSGGIHQKHLNVFLMAGVSAFVVYTILWGFLLYRVGVLTLDSGKDMPWWLVAAMLLSLNYLLHSFVSTDSSWQGVIRKGLVYGLMLRGGYSYLHLRRNLPSRDYMPVSD